MKEEIIKVDKEAESPYELVKEYLPNGDTRLFVRALEDKKEEEVKKVVKKKVAKKKE